VHEFTCREPEVFLNRDAALHDERFGSIPDGNNPMPLQGFSPPGTELVYIVTI
jgi:hypothetical protein